MIGRTKDWCLVLLPRKICILVDNCKQNLKSAGEKSTKIQQFTF